MRRYLIASATLLGLVLTTGLPVSAQTHKSAVGWMAGVISTSSLNNGASGSGDLVDLKPDLTWTLGAHYDRWLGNGHVGFRVEGAFARQTLPWTQGDRSIYLYMGDVDVLLRPMAPTPQKKVLPYVTGGAGAVWWALGKGPGTSYSPAGASYANNRVELAAFGGVGVDIVTPWNWGEGPMIVRLEARDLLQFASNFTPIDAEAGEFGVVHNMSLVLGLHTGLGLLPARY